MKSNYRIDLEVEDKEHIDKVLSQMGISIDHMVISVHENTLLGYFVSLSKYELLYIRLACKFREVHDLTKYEHSD